MPATVPESLRGDRLLAHIRVLCEQIGPRPSCSPQERQAASYVQRKLDELGIKDVQVQPFKSHRSVGELMIPIFLLGIFGLLMGLLGKRRGRALGGMFALTSSLMLRALTRGVLPFFQPWIARHDSQNVIARIPARKTIKHRLYLIGHLDSNKQRMIAPPPNLLLMKPLQTVGLISGILSGLSLLRGALRGKRRGFPTLELSALAGTLGFTVAAIADESQPFIDGANDNATAVSVLLGIAEALQAEPLDHTEVTLLFTGCEEVMCTGMASYLDCYKPPRHNTLWLDLEMVGTGNICYVTKHGLSHLSEYQPSSEMLDFARNAAQKHPELTIAGKDMLIVEEVATLVNRGYKAMCIAGYNQEGFLPNWHRLTDKLARIEPETLSRAARYAWAILHEIDAH